VAVVIAVIVQQTEGSNVGSVLPIKEKSYPHVDENVVWEQDPSETASNIENEEKQQMERKLDVLEAYHISEVQHYVGISLESPLLGVAGTLKEWRMSLHVQDAGLFHSAFGTEVSNHQSIPDTDRSVVREAIGEEAEALVWTFGNMDRSSFERQVKILLWTCRTRRILGMTVNRNATKMTMNGRTFLCSAQ
jgi:hypothetical protein